MGQVLLRVSVTTYQTVVCPGNVMFDEEFISREAFGIAPSQERLRSGGGADLSWSSRRVVSLG